MNIYDYEEVELILCLMFAGLVILIVFMNPCPSEKDVQNCMKATNYTAERCEWELTR